MVYDVAIVGGGCAGLPAGMYAGRMNLKTILFAEIPGGLITTTHVVENWPGVITMTGPDLGDALWQHAKANHVETKSESVKKIVRLPAGEGKIGGFEIQTLKNRYYVKSVVIATGTNHKEIGVLGEQELKNRGVSYCALCDGAFYREKVVAVVGGADSAAKEALFLSSVCKKVYLIVRGTYLKAEPVNTDLVNVTPNIEVMFQEEVAEVVGTNKVEGVKLKSGKEIPLEGVFVAIGHIPRTELAADLGVALNDHGEIMINRHSETNLPGVYSAGDCTDSTYKQAIIGAAEGVNAALSIFDYLRKNSIECNEPA